VRGDKGGKDRDNHQDQGDCGDPDFARAGLGAAAAGLLISLAAKLALPLLHGRRVPSLAFALITFVAVALARVPLYWVVALLAPVSVAVFWWRAK